MSIEPFDVVATKWSGLEASSMTISPLLVSTSTTSELASAISIRSLELVKRRLPVTTKPSIDPLLVRAVTWSAVTLLSRISPLLVSSSIKPSTTVAFETWESPLEVASWSDPSVSSTVISPLVMERAIGAAIPEISSEPFSPKPARSVLAGTSS